jgi:hypothetical protein
LRGTHERGAAVLVKPLHGEDRARQRVVPDPSVRIGPVPEQRLDVLEMVHVRLGNRIVAAFDVAVVGGEVQRRPSALVGPVRPRRVPAGTCRTRSAGCWSRSAAASANSVV